MSNDTKLGTLRNVTEKQSPTRRFAHITEDTARTTPTHDVPGVAESFNFPREIDELRLGAQYTTDGHAARTLVRLPAFRIVLFVLKSSTEFKQHHTAQPVAIQMLSGRVRITLPNRSFEQGAGEMLLLESRVRHDVTALVDSAFLLSMPWSERTEV